MKRLAICSLLVLVVVFFMIPTAALADGVEKIIADMETEDYQRDDSTLLNSVSEESLTDEQSFVDFLNTDNTTECTHSYIAAVIEPTCTDKGYTEYTCELCGDIYADNYIDALNHNFVNDKCTRCGIICVHTQLSAPEITVCHNDELSGKPYLAWKAIDGADSYAVYRAASANGTYTKMFTTANTHYTNTTAEVGVTYYYKVMAHSDKSDYADSPFSNVYCRTCDCGEPIVVSSRNDELSGKPYLAWKAVDGADCYAVYRATSANGTYTKMFTTANTHYTNTTAEVGATYYYKVMAHSDKSDYADSVFSDVYCRTCDCGMPVVVSSRNDELSGKPYLAWKAVDGADSYEVYRAPVADGNYTKMFTTANTHYTNTTAEVGVTYYYKVMAHSDVSDYADSVFSDVYCRTCDCAMPVVTAEYNTETKHPELSWQAVDGADRYIVYRSSKRDGTYYEMFTTQNTHYTNTYSEAGNTYYYKVTAVSDMSPYADSASDNVKIVACGHKKIFLSPSDQTANLYAYGNTNEAVQCRRIADALETMLKRCGFAVMNNQTSSMQERVDESNEWDADLHIPLHTNAANGRVSGTRIFTEELSGEDYKCAQSIYNCLAPVTPGKSENISAAPDLYEIKHSNAVTVYVESDFHDVPSTAKWIVEHVEDIAAAICRGICDYYNVEMCAD